MRVGLAVEPRALIQLPGGRRVGRVGAAGRARRLTAARQEKRGMGQRRSERVSGRNDAAGLAADAVSVPLGHGRSRGEVRGERTVVLIEEEMFTTHDRKGYKTKQKKKNTEHPHTDKHIQRVDSVRVYLCVC
jgi:hypothetical protein